jgi:hypothetical protein
MPQDYTHTAILSLELHPGFASFAVKASESDLFAPVQITFNEHISRKWHDLGRISTWLKRHQAIWAHQYDKVFITLHDIPHTIVPELEGSEQVLCALAGIEESAYQFFNQSLSIDWNWVMAVPNELSSLLHNYFNKPIFLAGIHGFTSLLEKKADRVNLAGMYITPEVVYFTFLKNGKSVFCNAYNYAAKDDLLYYTLLTFQGMQMDPQSDQLLVGGMITESSPLFEILYQYIRNVQFADWSLPLEAETLEKTGLPIHAFINLIGAVS